MPRNLSSGNEILPPCGRRKDCGTAGARDGRRDEAGSVWRNGMTARALVVQNTPRGGPGRLGSWLEEHGLTLDVVHAYAGTRCRRRSRDTGRSIVLGGGYMPDADDRAPWLAPTRQLAGEALESDVPVLGVCLGAQLLAHVAGGTVRAEHGLPEAGSTALTLRAESADDLLFPGCRASSGRSSTASTRSPNCRRGHRGWPRANAAPSRPSVSEGARGGSSSTPRRRRATSRGGTRRSCVNRASTVRS